MRNCIASIPDGIFVGVVHECHESNENSDASDLLHYRPAVLSDRPTDVLNSIFYMGNHHRFMFDQENLAHHCREAGFEHRATRTFDDAGVDSADRDYESLCMVCNIPTAS